MTPYLITYTESTLHTQPVQRMTVATLVDFAHNMTNAARDGQTRIIMHAVPLSNDMAAMWRHTLNKVDALLNAGEDEG